jgi:hypothetical protein
MKYLTIVILALIATAFCAVPDCAAYCNTIMTNCLTTNKQYADNATCLAVCAKFPLGASDGETAGNTVGCRQYHAGAAGTDAALHCPHAGPSGGDACGTKCEAYCSVIQGACTTTNAAYADNATCMAACGALSTTGAISDTSGISYFCHLYHATAAIGDPALHCPHAAASGSGACGTRCENYCEIIQKTCTGNNSQFSDKNTCMGFCETNPDGVFSDKGGNTKDCRVYHAYAGVALNAVATHCPHAGHSGGDVCGTYCQVYCNLAINVCNTTALQLYPNMAACTTACAGFAATGKPGDTSGNTVQCRIYHLGAAAATGDKTLHCPHGGQNPTAGCNGATTATTPTSTTEASKTGNAFGLFVSVLMTLIVALI